MSLKKFKISLRDHDTVCAIIDFTHLILALDIQSADELKDEMKSLIRDEFCENCNVHMDDCDCNQEPYYMAEYDDGADFED